ncbi:MAG TPA: TetR family transcriptional regulator C-terminal domain-containing protein [Chloroflexia bacterium]|nr:TetR family transcriptional regulator C-terminal domain-containing protein [Chloroflexia bacterium]
MPLSPAERLHRVVTALVEMRRHPEFIQFLDNLHHSQLTPQELRTSLDRRAHALQGILRQLIIEGQAAGEVAAGDPDQLLRAILACLDGLVRLAHYYPEDYDEHFPDAQIFLRMLKP